MMLILLSGSKGGFWPTRRNTFGRSTSQTKRMCLYTKSPRSTIKELAGSTFLSLSIKVKACTSFFTFAIKADPIDATAIHSAEMASFFFSFFFFIVLQDRKTWNSIFLMLAWFRVYTCKWSFSYSCCYCLLLFNKDCIKDKSSAMIHALHYLSSKISEFRLTLDTCRTFDQECCICGPLYCIWFAGHHQNHETYTERTCTHTHIYIYIHSVSL